MTNKDVLFLLPYPLHRAPSQRFRVENLLFLLDDAHISYDLDPFMNENTWQILYKNGNLVQKAINIAQSFLKRWVKVLFKSNAYKVIFIHREATPLGPPIVEWYLTKILGKKVIYDFDDAIWIPNTSAQNKIAGLVKSFGKVKHICRWSYKVSAGNDYLCSYALKSGARSVYLIPTVVNTSSRYNQLKKHEERKLIVGWTGSHSTLKFLDELTPIIEKIQKEIPFTFLVIADKKPCLQLSDWEFCPWNEEREIEDLLKIDIGVMPLKNDAWSEGKCGFKLIQYLSLGIPAIANSVGVNKDIIEHHTNGYLADNNEQWEHALRTLLSDCNLRKTMGEKGREKVVKEFSIESQKKNFLQLFH
jgi:glycosyltransferase involved in cell wall biosynthesis